MTFPTIQPGMPEWPAWEEYFVRHLGFEPLAMYRVRTRQQQLMTVPDQWPQWFDPGFVPGRFHPLRLDHSDAISPEARERMVQKFAKLCPHLRERALCQEAKVHAVHSRGLARDLPSQHEPPSEQPEHARKD